MYRYDMLLLMAIITGMVFIMYFMHEVRYLSKLPETAGLVLYGVALGAVRGGRERGARVCVRSFLCARASVLVIACPPLPATPRAARAADLVHGPRAFVADHVQCGDLLPRNPAADHF